MGKSGVMCGDFGVNGYWVGICWGRFDLGCWEMGGGVGSRERLGEVGGGVKELDYLL